MSAPEYILVFDFGLGGAALRHGALVRQWTVDIAEALDTAADVDAGPIHLHTQDNDGPHFALFSTHAPYEDVKRLGEERGATHALAGRVTIEEGRLDLSLNVWDLATDHLIYARVHFAALREANAVIPEMLIDLATRIECVRIPDAAMLREVFGTPHMGAYRAFAEAEDHLRYLALGGDAPDAYMDAVVLLIKARRIEPRFARAQHRLVDLVIDRLEGQDKRLAKVLVEQMREVQNQTLDEEALVFEAHLVLEDEGAAAQLLSELERRHAGEEDEFLAKLQSRLTVP